MAYCTEDDVATKLPGGRVEQFLRNAEVDLRTQIAAAQDEIDPELRAMGYEVPFASGAVPEAVQTLAAWKTIELLCFRVPALMDWHDRAERKVNRQLQLLRTREAELDDDAKDQDYKRTAVAVSGQTGRRFTQDRLDRM